MLKVSQAKELLKAIVQNKVDLAVVFVGHAGIGKTQTVKDIAEELGIPCSILRIGSLEDVGDLLGLPIQDGSEMVYTTPPWLQPLLGASSGILFLDEVNRAKETLKTAVMSILDEKKLYTWSFPHVTVVGAINPATEEYSVEDMDIAEAQRAVLVPVVSSLDDVVSYAVDHNWNREVIDYISILPDTVSKMPEVPVQRRGQDPNGRILRQLNEALKLKDVIDNNVFEALVAAVLGPERFAAYKQLKEYKATPIPSKSTPESVAEFFKKAPKDKLYQLARIFAARLAAEAKGKLLNKEKTTQYCCVLMEVDERCLMYFLRLVHQDVFKLIDVTNKKLENLVTKVLKELLPQK